MIHESQFAECTSIIQADTKTHELRLLNPGTLDACFAALELFTIVVSLLSRLPHFFQQCTVL